MWECQPNVGWLPGHLKSVSKTARPASWGAAAAKCPASIVHSWLLLFGYMVQEKEHMVLQQQQLQVQLAKQAEEVKESNVRYAQLVKVLDEKSTALEATEVGSCGSWRAETGSVALCFPTWLAT